MRLRIVPRLLKLAYARPFGIARWTRSATDNVLVCLQGGGIEGQGEGAPNARYGESADRALHVLAELGELEAPRTLAEAEALLLAVEPRFAKDRAALAALDGALGDWLARSLGVSCATLFELSPAAGQPEAGPVTSFTIGLAERDELIEKVREAAPYPVLKIKLGTANDREILATLRGETDKLLRVDANEGWQDRETAARHLEILADDGGVQLVEQPLPAGRLADVAWLRARTALPLIADEDCVPEADLDALLEAYDGLNLKLDKQGGILAARRLLRAVQSKGGDVMVGCMVASSLALTQAAYVAMQATWADLDGHLLLAEDPYDGLRVDADGRVRLPPSERLGLGVRDRGPTSTD